MCLRGRLNINVPFRKRNSAQDTTQQAGHIVILSLFCIDFTCFMLIFSFLFQISSNTTNRTILILNILAKYWIETVFWRNLEYNFGHLYQLNWNSIKSDKLLKHTYTIEKQLTYIIWHLLYLCSPAMLYNNIKCFKLLAKRNSYYREILFIALTFKCYNFIFAVTTVKHKRHSTGCLAKKYIVYNLVYQINCCLSPERLTIYKRAVTEAIVLKI